MSAVAGIYYLDGRPVDPADLHRMVERLSHRGRDRCGEWTSGAAGLGHRLLCATPESVHERLPLANATGDLVLTADARLDNRDELIAALDLTGRPLEEITDGDLILRAYDRWGERCPERLLGDFTFALWDGRRRSMFCARDHLGVRPFYYHYAPGRLLVFASEIKALLCLAEVPRRLNELRVADYLVPLLDDKTVTFYVGILRLPPAHTLTVGPGGARLERYWSLDSSRDLRFGSDGEYAEALRERFTEAVRCRLRSAYPVGALLSGGLDSSSIVCVARRMLAEDGDRCLQTFSAVFEDVPECDERRFIESVAADGGLCPHCVRGDQVSPLVDLDRVLEHQDEPFYAPNLFLHWALYRAAREQGVRILLDGIDGDTTVSHGSAHLADLARTGRWRALSAEATAIARRSHVSPIGTLWRLGIKPLLPQPAREAWRWLKSRNWPLGPVQTIVRADFGRRIGLRERLRALEGENRRPPRTAREEHCRRLNAGVIPFALEVADRAAAAFSLQPAYPFFDRRLVEFCLALPAEQKICEGWTRVVMRRAMDGLLPDEVRWRARKTDLGPNFNRGLLAFERQRLEEVVLRDPKIIEEYVDLPALRRAYHRYLQRGATEDALSVWRAVTLALWLQHSGATR